MDGLARQLREGPFDWVVVDTPPVLAVTDASLLAKHATGVVFVLGANMTRRRAAERAIETLAIGGPRILGAVLNRVAYSPEAYYSYEKYHADSGETRRPGLIACHIGVDAVLGTWCLVLGPSCGPWSLVSVDQDHGPSDRTKTSTRTNLPPQRRVARGVATSLPPRRHA